ncbi:MAG TPA: NAD-dependent epimerase/dehydratase family protein [Gaiellaceae bacterium]|nr:NAD-dependent epimerase/dehydratase family protein [Gaiellaceae bacterium]
MTTLITGATGFLGQHLARLLVDRGDRVRVLARPGTPPGALRELDAEIVEGDVREGGGLPRAAAGCELVFHLAGIVSHERRRLPEMRAVNVDATRRLLASVEPTARVVHVSSVAAIGPASSPHRPADEQQEFPAAAARLPYAATKREGELLALEAAAAGLDVVVANPGFLLGPGDLHRVSTWPVHAYLAGKLRFTTRGGLSFVDVRDVAHGLVALADRGRAGERTILTAEAGNLGWPAFFELIASVSGLRRRTVPLPVTLAVAAAALPGPVSPDQVRAASNWWFYTPAKAERELGFRTRPLAETIADTIADHRSHP